MNVSSKFQSLQSYFRLKKQESLIEMSVETLMNNSKVDVETWNNYKQDISRSRFQRNQENDVLRNQVIAIYEELKNAKSLINVDNVDKIDLELLKRKLLSLWRKIEDFQKSHDQIDQLITEQKVLEDDLGTKTRLIKKQKNLSLPGHSVCKKITKQSKQEDLTKECFYEGVQDFCTLLAKTGHTGNWSEEDHLLYVKLRKRLKKKNFDVLVQAIRTKCPDLSEENIISHDRWYKTYLELREKQRIAVQNWRKCKEIDRLKKLSRDKSPVPPKQVKQIERSKSVLETEMEHKKEILRRWKEQREKSKREEKELAENLRSASRQEAEQKRRARNERLKKIIAERKVSKSEVQPERNVSTPSFASELILQIYRERDQRFAEKKRNLVASKIKETLVPKIIAKPTVESRLFNETIAWQEKHKKVQPQTTNRSVNYIKDLPKRAMTSWKSYEIFEPASCRQR